MIITDRRGFGCSDRFSPTDIPPFEVFTDDILSVMDAVGSDRAAIFGTWDCALIATLWAAGYPERAAALILADAFITYEATPETPWMPTPEQWEERIGTALPAGLFWGDELLDSEASKRAEVVSPVSASIGRSGRVCRGDSSLPCHRRSNSPLLSPRAYAYPAGCSWHESDRAGSRVLPPRPYPWREARRTGRERSGPLVLGIRFDRGNDRDVPR